MDGMTMDHRSISWIYLPWIYLPWIYIHYHLLQQMDRESPVYLCLLPLVLLVLYLYCYGYAVLGDSTQASKEGSKQCMYLHRSPSLDLMI